MLVKCGTIDITDKVLSLNKKGTFSDKRIIGQVPSFQLNLQLNNKDGYFDDKLNNFFYYKEANSNEEKVFVVYEKPEKYTKQLTLTLYDRSYELDVRYDTVLDYANDEITINDQLDEMETLTGFSFIRDNIPEFVKSQKVSWYDNTITCRSYLSAISELFASNVFADGENSFNFIPLSKEIKHSTSISSDFKKNGVFNLTKICFDNSLIKIEKGTDEGNTLYISSNNLYVDSNNAENIVSYVYSVLGGLSVYSVNKFSTKNIVDLQLGDIVNYNDEFTFVVTDMTSKVVSQTASLQELSGELYSKNEEKMINKIPLDTKVRTLRVEFDQEKQRWSVVSKNVDENSQKISQLILDNEKISLSVSSTEKKVETLEKQVTVTNVSSQWGKSTSKTVAPTSWLDTKPTLEIGEYMWMREKYTYSDTTIKYDGVRMISAEDGEDAVLLQILSSNGHMFKNSSVSTTLTVEILIAGSRITSSRDMYARFGNHAKITWQQKQQGETEYSDIDESDARISDNGFIFTLGAEDLKYETVYSCYLDY